MRVETLQNSGWILTSSRQSAEKFNLHVHVLLLKVTFWIKFLIGKFVNRIWKTVRFELGKEIEKDVFPLVTSLGQRKFHEESNLRPSDSALRCSSFIFYGKVYSSIVKLSELPLQSYYTIPYHVAQTKFISCFVFIAHLV